jgi:transglutaminase-like putative cysteine protease
MDKRLQQNQGTMQKMDWPVGSRIKVIFALISISFIIYLLIPRFSAGDFGSQFGESDQYYSDKKWENQANKDISDSEPDTENNQDHPSDTKPRHDEEASGKFQYNGFSDKFDIRGKDTGTGMPPNVIVAYLQAQHDTYLKVETFDKFNGISWEKSIRSDVKKKLKFGKITLVENEKTNFRQNITIAENLGPYIPAASIPVQLHFPATVISIDSYQMLKIPSGLSKGTHYTIDSSVKFINGRLFSGTHYQPRKNDLQLPEKIDERIRNLSQSITKNASSELEAAKLLEKHLRENYQYSFESIFNSQNRTPVAKFLFDDKKGHCEYFASSLAIMLRTLGIHSRLITGFSATTRNPLTGFREIRVLDGHAWVEAWVDNKGWVVLEPTPIYTQAMQYEDRLSAKEIQDYAEKLEKMYQQADISHGLSLEFIITSAWLNISTLFIDALSYIKLFFKNSWQLLAGLAGIFIIAIILWGKWKLTILAKLSYFKVISYKPRGQKTDICFYMKHIQKVMNAKGVSRLPGTTIEQYVEILDVLPDVDIDKRQLIDLINSSYYAAAPAHDLDPELLRQFFLKL